VSTHDTDRDYPVVDRVRDDDDRGREDDEFDPRDELDDDTDDGPAHRADSPIDGVPGESDPAGPGDPLPGEGLSADGTRYDEDEDRAGEPVVVAVDDVAAQDSGVVTAPPATDGTFGDDTDDTDEFDDTDDADDTDRDVVGDATADETSGPPVEALPVPVPVPADDATVHDAGEDTGTGGSDDYEAAWRDLQVTFVDDPAAAVRGAAELLERAVADLRASLEGSEATEDLRTAFRRYRDVFRNLH
jgi:hypothetical protein